MNKKIITSILLFVTLAMLPFSGQADYPTGDLLYHADVVPNAEFTWNVKHLSGSGDYADYLDYNYLDQITLAEGQTIKLKVTIDPETVTDPISNISWYDLYVNNVKVNNPENISLAMFIGFAPFGEFVAPTEYQNATGTYGVFEQLYDDVKDAGAFIDVHFYEQFSVYTSVYDYIVNVAFTLVDNIFQLRYYITYDEHYIDPVAEDEMREVVTMEAISAFDATTGIALEYKTKVEYDFFSKIAGNVTVDENGHYYIQLLSEGYEGYQTDEGPFSWVFSILGLTVFGVMVVIIRKRRR